MSAKLLCQHSQEKEGKQCGSQHRALFGAAEAGAELMRCHFPYAGHRGKIKVTEINFAGLQKDEQSFFQTPSWFYSVKRFAGSTNRFAAKPFSWS